MITTTLNDPANPTINSTQSYWDSQINPLAETLIPSSTHRAAFLQELSTPRYANLTAIYRTFSSAAITGPIDPELVEHLPSTCRVIAHNGAGYDQLHIPALSARGIIACNVPTAVDDATADTALFLLLGALRNFNAGMAALRRGDWRGRPAPALGGDPQGRTVGILGMGGIGRNFAHKCRALGMEVVYYSRRRPSDEAKLEREYGWSYTGFEALLKTSDVVSVHVPLNEGTRHLVGRKELAMCREGVVIVNTARGAVIDEAALVEALDNGHVASAGLDVYEEEPEIHKGLVRNDKCVLVPHMGTWCDGTQKRMEEWCIDNVRRALGPKKSWRDMSVVPEQKELLDRILNGERS